MTRDDDALVMLRVTTVLTKHLTPEGRKAAADELRRTDTESAAAAKLYAQLADSLEDFER